MLRPYKTHQKITVSLDLKLQRSSTNENTPRHLQQGVRSLVTDSHIYFSNNSATGTIVTSAALIPNGNVLMSLSSSITVWGFGVA